MTGEQAEGLVVPRQWVWDGVDMRRLEMLLTAMWMLFRSRNFHPKLLETARGAPAYLSHAQGHGGTA
jgi:hypothetical protein